MENKPQSLFQKLKNKPKEMSWYDYMMARPATNKKKGYQKLILRSPDKKNIRYFKVDSERTSDTVIAANPDQKVIKDLLSKGWKIFMPNGGSSACNRKGKQNKDKGLSKSQMRRRRLRDWKRYKEAQKKQLQQQKEQKSQRANSFERAGELMKGEILGIQITEYSSFISGLSRMQQMGGGKKLAKVGIDIDIFDFMMHKTNNVDFEPDLYTPQYAPLKRMLLTVDASGSCEDLIPLTRALGKRLATRPDLELTYDENYNGHPIDGNVQANIRNGIYDYIIYFGDTDVYYSFIVVEQTPMIAFIRNDGMYHYGSSQPMNVMKPSKSNYYVIVDFKKGDTLAAGLHQAVEHFKDMLV